MPFSLWMKESNRSFLWPVAELLYSVLLLPVVYHRLLAAITLTKAEIGGRKLPQCKGLMLLLLFSLRSFQRPAASSSDVLTCVDLSVYLMTEGNSDFFTRAAVNHQFVLCWGTLACHHILHASRTFSSFWIEIVYFYHQKAKMLQ